MELVKLNHQNSFNAKHQNGLQLDSDYVFADFKSGIQFASKMTSHEKYGAVGEVVEQPKTVVKEEKLPIVHSPNDIHIELLTEADNKEVLEMLKRFFFKDEPLNTYLDLGECRELEEWSLSCIPEKCSFKAVNLTGEIVGVFLNGIVRKSDHHESHDADSGAATCKHPKFKKILTLMEHIESQFDLFKLYPDTEIFLDGKILSVNENYRGCGIAGKLTAAAMDYMREHNISIYHILCSSHFSARVCEKLDFEVVYELPYADYMVNGENPLLPAKPHAAAKILIKRI